MRVAAVYLEEVDDVDVDDDERLVYQVDDAVADWNVAFDHLGHYDATWVMEIADQRVTLHVDCTGHLRSSTVMKR
jgi:hypothetical protein